MGVTVNNNILMGGSYTVYSDAISTAIPSPMSPSPTTILAAAIMATRISTAPRPSTQAMSTTPRRSFKSLNLTGSNTNPPVTSPPASVSPKVTSLVESPASGVLHAGQTVTLTVGMSEAVTVSGGSPTLTLSDGGSRDL